MLRIAPNLSLDPDYVGAGTFALLAKKGAGKTYQGRVMAEEFYKAKVPFVALDPMDMWWGLRAAADGKGEGIPVPVFGGPHGDAPLEPTAGKVMADLVVDDGLSMILSLKHFGSRSAERRFAYDFLERLYRRNSDLVHVLMDEADLFAPQNPQQGDKPLLGVTENIVRRGRNNGIGITLMTQRPAVLHKDVLTQVDGLVAMRIIGLHDREAIDKWFAGHGDDPEQAATVKATLASLENGECWWWIPEQGILKRVQVRRSHTFDSSPSRKRGERRREPKTFAEIDMGAIQEKMADTIERAKADDPRELRKRITGLESELAKRPLEADATEVEVEVEVPVPFIPVAVADAAVQLVGAVENLSSSLRSDAETIARIGATLDAELKADLEAPPAELPPPKPKPRLESPSKPRPAPRDGVDIERSDSDVRLKKGPREMLALLAQEHPKTMTRAQLAMQAGIKASGSTFSSYLSNLRTAGYLDEPGDGRYGITEAGLADVGDSVPPRPRTAVEVQALALSRLKKRGPRLMLEELLSSYPDGLARDDLATQVDIDPSGSTFSSYLSNLRTMEVIEERGGLIYAAAELWP